ncbi:MAG: ABC transporter permease [Bacteroidetes bacterium]|nr:ABC transporter permease [Bacteroidota bacterium]
MRTKRNIPPRFATWLLKKFSLSSRQPDALGDIEELYEQLFEDKGKKKAKLWYWKQVLRSIPHLINNLLFWGKIMFGNYSLIAVRNLLKNKLYSFINIMGLAVGFACCVFIYLYISHEMSYDTFHKDYESIYRIPMSKTSATRVAKWAINTAPLGPELIANFPEVENAGRMAVTEEKSVKYEDLVFSEGVNYTDSEFLEIYSVEFVRGDSRHGLSRPETAVITESVANKYFGVANPIGKKLLIDEKYFEVTAIIKDVTANSHINFNILLSLKTMEEIWWYTDWPTATCFTYVKLAKGINAKEFENKISNYAQKYAGAFNQAGIEISYWLQPIADIHLYSHLDFEFETPGNQLYLFIFFGVGALILFIACMNFINLSTARSSNRTNEVGIRKAIGAYRNQLFQQFLFESILIVFISSIIASIIVAISLQGFNQLTGFNFSLGEFINPSVILVFLMLALTVGLLAGTYPALFISSFNPAYILKGLKLSTGKGAMFRKILVVTQFSISIILIVSTLIIFQQIDYMMNSDLGFDEEQKLVLVLPETGEMRDDYETAKNVFKSSSDITGATASSHLPGREFSSTRIYVNNREAETGLSMAFISHDHDFYEVYGLEMVAGRHHMKEMGADTVFGNVVFNEAAVKAFGFNSVEEAMEQQYWRRGLPLIGVVKDFHVSGLQSEVEPMYTIIGGWAYRYITLNLNTANIQKTMAFVEGKWKEIFPEMAFEYFFLDTEFDNQYKQEMQMGSLFRISTLLGLFIACLGLFGLSAFMVERRIKEIGIRKVLGATVSGIVMIISKEFLLLIGLANIIAWPIAYFTMQQWLQNFAYATSVSFILFIIAGVLALSIAFITVGSLALRAAYSNPVDSLKCE